MKIDLWSDFYPSLLACLLALFMKYPWDTFWGFTCLLWRSSHIQLHTFPVLVKIAALFHYAVSWEFNLSFISTQMESGGTVLSTNWTDVGKRKVEVNPPDDMEWKQYWRNLAWWSQQTVSSPPNSPGLPFITFTVSYSQLACPSDITA